MINLSDPAALVRIVTSSTADIEVHSSWTDYTAGPPEVYAPAGVNFTVVTATTTTIVPSPASGTIRNLRTVFIRNTHASTSNTVTLEHNDGGNISELFKAALAAGEMLVINEQGVPFVYDAFGGVKMGASAASDTVPGVAMIASVTDMETATDVNKIVTAGRFHRHPASPKVWLSCGTSANIQQSYNVTSLTDTGTGIVTVTIATDFAGTDYCALVATENINTTLAMADARQGNIRFNTRAAGSVGFNCRDDTTTTNVIKDPNSWHIAMFGDQ